MAWSSHKATRAWVMTDRGTSLAATELTLTAEREPGLVVKPYVWLALYFVGLIVLWPLARNLWYLPAGLRLGVMWVAPRRLWLRLMLAEWLALLGLSLWHGYDPGQIDLWISLLLPWPCYALAVYVLRPMQHDLGLSAPLVMARLLAAALLGALLLAPWLARFHPLSEARGDLVAGSFEFMLGDLIGVLMLAPAMVLLTRRGIASDAQRAALSDIALYLMPILLGAAVLTYIAPQMAPIGFMLSFGPLIYLAFRHGCSGAALALPIVGIMLEIGHRLGLELAVPAIQLALVAISIGTLMLGAAISALRESHWLLAQRNRELLHKNETLHDLAGELRAMAQQLTRLQEQGQRELAAELHDELGQSITAVATRVALAERSCHESATRHMLHALREQVRTLHDSLHRALRQLRPLVLDNYGLRRALAEGPLRELAEDAGLDYRSRFHGDVDSLDEDTTTAIYRVCQEAVTNCVRHARARLFILDLTVQRVHDGRWLWVELELADDGDGDTEPGKAPANSGLGLAGIRSRVLALGGDYRYEPGPGGTRHHVLIHRPATDKPPQRAA